MSCHSDAMKKTFSDVTSSGLRVYPETPNYDLSRYFIRNYLVFHLFVTPWTVQSMEFSRPEYQSWQPFHSLGELPNPGIKPRSPTLQVDSLPAEPPEMPKNTGVGSLSLLQRIFPTQESNPGFLHCRQILYQLSYQGSVLRETQIKTTMRYYSSPTKIVQFEKTDITKC